jgi:hypothetical protein
VKAYERATIDAVQSGRRDALIGALALNPLVDHPDRAAVDRGRVGRVRLSPVRVAFDDGRTAQSARRRCVHRRNRGTMARHGKHRQVGGDDALGE